MKKIIYILSFFFSNTIIAQNIEVARNIQMTIGTLFYENVDNDPVIFPTTDDIIEINGLVTMSNQPNASVSYTLNQVIQSPSPDFTVSGSQILTNYVLFNNQNYCLSTYPLNYSFNAWEEDANDGGTYGVYNSTIDDSYANVNGSYTAATFPTGNSNILLTAQNGFAKYDIWISTSNNESRIVPDIAATPADKINICSGQNAVINVNSAKSMSEYKVKYGNDTIPVIRGTNTLTITPANFPQLSVAGNYSFTVYEKVLGNCYTRAGTGNVVVSTPLPALNPIMASSSTVICGVDSVGLVYTGSASSPSIRIFWQKDGVTQTSPVCNANSASCAFYANSAGTYRVGYTNSCGTVYSNNIVITETPPTGNLIKENTVKCFGESIALFATFSAGTDSIFWYNNLVPVDTTMTTSAQTSAGILVQQNGFYTCVFKNRCGASSTGSVQVIFDSLPSPNIITPDGSSFCAGDSIIIYSPEAAIPTTYQWRKNGINLTGKTNRYLLVKDAGTYSCVLTNRCGTTTSKNMIATVGIPNNTIEITSANGRNYLCNGTTLTLIVPSNQAISYQWRKNAVNISGAISNTYVANTVGTYSCAITYNCGNRITNNFVVIDNSIPTPTISASNTTICSGDSTLLTCSSVPNAQYVWLYEGFPLQVYTQTYYAKIAGNYSCGVTNICGERYSNVITVTVGGVRPTVNITAAGGDTHLCTGESIVLTATVANATTYQWKKDGTNISGATAISYTATTAGTYTCVVTNSCGNVTSNNIVLTQGGLPVASITTPGGSTLLCPGGSGLLMTAAAGTGYTYVWRKDGIIITGATANTYTATTVGTYACAITNACGTTSTSKVLTAGVAPTATLSNPSGVTIMCNSNTVQLIANTGTGLTYQWKKDGVNIGVATSQSFYIANTAGTYTCIVTNACGSATSNSIILVNGNITAAISTGNSTSLCNGSTATLNANSGTGLIYQWLRNGINTGNATQTYTVNTAGTYTCVVSNTCGSSTSNAIIITSGLAPSATITSSSINNILCSGSSISLSANIGTGLTYQWYRGGGAISGAVSANYSTSSTGNYTCIVSNSCGSTTSNTITLIDGNPPTGNIIATGGATRFCDGASVTINAEGGAGITYQWRRNGINISGATAQTYTVISSGAYTCAVTNTCGTTNSNTLNIAAIPNTNISTQPVSQTKNSGQTLTLSVVATGNNLSYQWQKNGVNISGATAATYTKANITTADAGNYSCIVNGECGGTKTSNVAVITVNPSTPIISKLLKINAIYPNPTHSNLIIQLDLSEQQDLALEIIDVEGKILSSNKVTVLQNQQTISMDVSSYAVGTYILSITANDGIAYSKFVKN